MPGPLPKDRATRARRNVSASQTDLDPMVRVKAPGFPRGLFGEVAAVVDEEGTEVTPARARSAHPLTRRWWRVVWQSPMAPLWLAADVERLYLVAALRDRFYREPTSAMAAEIRQQERPLGLTPEDRKRLDWRIQHAPAASGQQPAASEDEEPTPAAGPDPRDVLRLVG